VLRYESATGRYEPSRDCARSKGGLGKSRSDDKRSAGDASAIVAESDLRAVGSKLTAVLETTPESGPLSDNSGDNSVTARS
jgi:hypothetical protein